MFIFLVPILKKSKHKTAFGNVVKYLEVRPDETNIQSIEDWDNAIQMASDHFSRTMVIKIHYLLCSHSLSKHNIVTNNCHDHVCMALNSVKYKGKNNWNNVSLVAELCLHSRYVSTSRLVQNWVPFVIILLIVVGM